MSMKKGIPGTGKSRKNSKVGPDYAETRFEAPWNADLGGPFGTERDDKAILSEAGTTFEGGGAPLEKGKYDELWEGK
jgi:hypothetical protein